MSNNTLVSIILNCKNGEKYLNHALSSVLKQTYKNWELIFFDNFSTDNSKKIFMSYKDERFKYFLNTSPSNLSVARNRAINQAKGNIITILDHDDWWVENKLQDQVSCFANNNVDLIFTDFYQYYEGKNIIKKINSKIEGSLYYSIINNYNLGLNTFAFNSNLFKKHKFDEDYHIIGDFSLIVEISKFIKWTKLNKPSCYYRIHDFSESNSGDLKHIKELKHWYYYKFKNKEKNKDLKKKIINKLNYMKFLYNIKKNNKEYIINFKKTYFLSNYKAKEVAYIFIFYLKNLIKNFTLKT